jgi:ankyrin repeat protein
VCWLVLDLCFEIVSAGNEDVTKELVGAGANVNAKNDKGATPLYVAAACIYSLMVNFSWSALLGRHYAASKSRVDVRLPRPDYTNMTLT